MTEKTINALLASMEKEAISKGAFDVVREGFFRGTLKASFVRSFELARFFHKRSLKVANEGDFFMSAALRSACEDLIVLKFLARLKREQRDDVIRIKMLLAVHDATVKQAAFFRKYRPFQPVLKNSLAPEAVIKLKDELTAIGKTSGMWSTERKLPPVEQMASKVGLRSYYDFVYAGTSEIVHFNARIAFRSGWGHLPKVEFSSTNFCRYYLQFGQFLSGYTFQKICAVFGRALRLSDRFNGDVETISDLTNNILRWPELVTFEEMNFETPSPILRIVLRVAHLSKIGKKHKIQKRQGGTSHESKTLSIGESNSTASKNRGSSAG